MTKIKEALPVLKVIIIFS